MTYDQLIEAICRSSADDWLHITEAGIHTYRHDLLARIERVDVGDELPPTLSDDQRFAFDQNWRQQVFGTDARAFDYRIYYGSSIVEQFVLISVDGGNARLPVPESDSNLVTRKNYRIAKTVDYLGTLDNYLKHARLTVENEPVQSGAR